MSSTEWFSEQPLVTYLTGNWIRMSNASSRTKSWGYPTEDAYYRDASSSDSVLAIRIPFLAIAAADDPVTKLGLSAQPG